MGTYYIERRDHELAGKKVTIAPSKTIVDGLHGRGGVIEYVKFKMRQSEEVHIDMFHTRVCRAEKLATWYVIKLDEPFHPAPHIKMEHIQVENTKYLFFLEPDKVTRKYESALTLNEDHLS